MNTPATHLLPPHLRRLTAALVLGLAWMAAPGVLRAEESPKVSVALEYTLTSGATTVVTVPACLLGGALTIPILVNDKMWITSIQPNLEAKTIFVSMTEHYPAEPVQLPVFAANFELVYGKSIPLLQSSVGWFGLIFTK